MLPPAPKLTAIPEALVKVNHVKDAVDDDGKAEKKKKKRVKKKKTREPEEGGEGGETTKVKKHHEKRHRSKRTHEYKTDEAPKPLDMKRPKEIITTQVTAPMYTTIDPKLTKQYSNDRITPPLRSPDLEASPRRMTTLQQQMMQEQMKYNQGLISKNYMVPQNPKPQKDQYYHTHNTFRVC